LLPLNRTFYERTKLFFGSLGRSNAHLNNESNAENLAYDTQSKRKQQTSKRVEEEEEEEEEE